MATRKWARDDSLLDKIQQWQPKPLDPGALPIPPTADLTELQGLAARVGQVVWSSRDDTARLQAIAQPLRLQATIATAEQVAATQAAYARAMCAVLDAVISREGSPWLLEGMLGERIEDILATRGSISPVVDVDLAGAFLKPLLRTDEEEGMRPRRLFRQSIAALFSAISRLDAAALNGELPDIRFAPAYQELRALQTILTGVLAAVPIQVGAAASPELSAVH